MSAVILGRSNTLKKVMYSDMSAKTKTKKKS
jgi:hypothetical protein